MSRLTTMFVTGLFLAIFSFALTTAYSAEAITGTPYGKDSVELFSAPNGKIIGQAKSAILENVRVSAHRNGFARLLGFGRTVWIREKSAFFGPAPRKIRSRLGSSDKGHAGTQGLHWY